jgi:poly-gamma-glutamate capsule biosynthesis protein CapA/YwtB (metallophosphatase superfamily)
MMNRSRTETMRMRRRKRRTRLLVANLILLAAIAGVWAWSAAQSEHIPPSNNTAQPPPSGQEIGTDAQEPVADAQEPTDSQPEADEATTETNGASQEPDAAEEVPGVEQGKIRMAFVGDVLLGEYVGTLMKRHGYDYPYAHVRSLLQDADVTAANLETSVTGEREKPGIKQYEFRSPPEALPAFADAGFDLVNLANNHSLDFGEEGLRDTIRYLRDNTIEFVGAGEDAYEAYAPVFVEKNGLKIAFLGLSRVIPFGEWKAGKNKMGLAETYDYTRPVEEIKKAKESADLVVVMVHWGEERKLQADPLKQTELGRRFIDAGADLIIGSHPHVLQGIEGYKGKWIVYSLGNFIFTKSKDPLTYESGILYAECGKTGECSIQLVPMKADTPQPVPMEADQASAVLRRVSTLSPNAKLNEEGYVELTNMEQGRSDE